MFHNVDHSSYYPMQRDNLDMLILPLNLWQHPVFIPLMIMNYDKNASPSLQIQQQMCFYCVQNLQYQRFGVMERNDYLTMI